MKKLDFPMVGDEVPASHASDEMLRILATRRSSSAALLTEPAPKGDELDQILKIAARVPDHRKMTPFRFIVFEGSARDRMGDAVIAAARQRNDDCSTLSDDQLRSLLMRAPTVVCVVSSVDPNHRTPAWEQELTAGAACYNLLLAASASGYAGQWISEWMAFDENINRSLSLTENERIAGFIYLGTATENPKERDRPNMSAIIQRY